MPPKREKELSQGIEMTDFSRGGPVTALKTPCWVGVPGAESSSCMASRSEVVVELFLSRRWTLLMSYSVRDKQRVREVSGKGSSSEESHSKCTLTDRVRMEVQKIFIGLRRKGSGG